MKQLPLWEEISNSPEYGQVQRFPINYFDVKNDPQNRESAIRLAKMRHSLNIQDQDL